MCAFRPAVDAGLGYHKGATPTPKVCRTYFLNVPAAKAVVARARAARERAGTLTGVAIGEDTTEPTRDVPGDVLAVFGDDSGHMVLIIAAAVAVLGRLAWRACSRSGYGAGWKMRPAPGPRVWEPCPRSIERRGPPGHSWSRGPRSRRPARFTSTCMASRRRTSPSSCAATADRSEPSRRLTRPTAAGPVRTGLLRAGPQPSPRNGAPPCARTRPSPSPAAHPVTPP